LVRAARGLDESRDDADHVLDFLRLPRSNVAPLEPIVAVLSQQPTVLVLDNMEHLLGSRFWVLGTPIPPKLKTQNLKPRPLSFILHPSS
jgi:hypothetical protein